MSSNRTSGGWLGLVDPTLEADKDVGSFDEPQVLVTGVRNLSVRGNRLGMKEGFAYASRQFIGFKPSMAHNLLECLAWLLTPSVMLSTWSGLYAIGVANTLLLGVFGLFLLIFVGMFAYALRLSPSLMAPGGVRLALILFAVIVL